MPHVDDFCIGEKRMQYPFLLFNKGLSLENLFKIFMNHFKEHSHCFPFFRPYWKLWDFFRVDNYKKQKSLQHMGFHFFFKIAMK